MIKPKYLNNDQSYNFIDNYFTQKKEEKNHSRISFNEPSFQPIIGKSGFSSKK